MRCGMEGVKLAPITVHSGVRGSKIRLRTAMMRDRVWNVKRPEKEAAEVRLRLAAAVRLRGAVRLVASC